MALCGDCRSWFASILDKRWVSDLNKSLAELSTEDVDGIVRNSEDPYFASDDILTINRNIDTALRQRSLCWLCCWTCLKLTNEAWSRQSIETDADEPLSKSPVSFPLNSYVILRSNPTRINLIMSSSLGSPLYFTSSSPGLRGISNRIGASEDIFTTRLLPDTMKYKPSCGLIYEYSMSRTDDSASVLKLDGIADLFEGNRTSIANEQSDCDATQFMCQCRVRRIRTWLHNCRTTHKACNDRSTDGSLLPKRLLRANKMGDDVHVVEAKDIPPGESVEYATLSHCWGPRQPLILTRINYAEFLSKVPTIQLGKTFSEAIELCRELNIGYLWVDCLCIIQDSIEDWQTEAPRMQYVYGNSTLNLAAAASKSSDEGFWRHNNTILSHSIEIKLPSYTLVEDIDTVMSILKYNHNNSPLLQRGWVLQECILPSRVLYSTKHQLVWQCRQSYAAELEKATDMSEIDFSSRSRGTAITNDMPIHAARTVADLDQAWEAIAVGYATTEVTRPEDRYYALSGLAALMQQQYRRFGIETRYMAGLWEHNIMATLFWDGSVSSHASPVAIPSWSWLNCMDLGSELRSSDGRRIRSEEQSSMRYLHGRIENLDHAPIYGPVKFAALRLEALFFTVTELYKAGDFSVVGFGGGRKGTEISRNTREMAFKIRLDEQEHTLTPTRKTMHCAVWRQGWTSAISEGSTDTERPDAPDHIVAALIVERRSAKSDGDDPLRKDTDVYRRVGVSTFLHDEYSQEYLSFDDFVAFFADDNLTKKEFWLV